jgi:hypothetical protein
LHHGSFGFGTEAAKAGSKLRGAQGMFKRAVPVICGMILLSAGARAQVTTGAILGMVTDSSGGVIPGVVISIVNVETGVSRAVLTDEAGRYSVPQLPLGTYKATADQPGFHSVVRSGILITVGREAVVDFVLQVGAVDEVVSVTGEVPLIETTSSSVSGLINPTQMRELPLNARSYEQFAFLQPNVYQERNETDVTNTGFAPKISAGGMRTAYNIYLEDGIDIADTTGQTPGSAAGQLMGIETLQEFRVLTSNYAAQYGNAIGAVIEVASRGGTNKLHGSLFEFLRNDVLDARSFFDTSKPPYRRNQFGGTVGGAIRKDRLFFFSSYEAMRQRLTTTETVFVPTAEAHMGILPDPTDPSKKVAIPLSADVKRYLDIYPVAQVDLGSGIGTYRFPFKGKTREDFFSGRIDYHHSNNVSYFGRYRVDDTDLVHRKCATCIDPWAEGLTSRNHMFSLGETRILSTNLINDFRFGFVRYTPETRLALTGPDPMIQFPSSYAAGIISFTTGFGSSGQGLASLGTLGRGFEKQHGNTFEWLDNLSYVKGAHTLKMGANIERMQDNVLNRTETGRYADTATFSFQSLQEFLQGQPRTYSGPVVSSPLGLSGRAWLSGFYFQDDYRMRSNFTLNLGVRYESVSPYSNTNNRFIILNDLFLEPKYGQKEAWSGRTCAGCVDPRVGLAWDVFSNARTVVKSGFGVFRSQLVHYNGYFQIPTGSLGGVNMSVDFPTFPNAAIPNAKSLILISPTGTGAGGVSVLPVIAKVPSGLQWNLTIDQQITKNMTVRLAYLGSHGYHLDTGYPANTNTYETRPDGSLYFAPGLHRIRPDYTAINKIVYDLNSMYNGLTITVGQRATRGMGFEVSYAFARATDDSSLENSSRTHLVAEMRPPDGRRNTYHGLSGLDMRHRLVGTATYDFPSMNSAPKLLRHLLSGWQANSIFQVTAGTPITPWIGFDRANTAASNAGESQRPSFAPGFSGKVPLCPCTMPTSLGGGIQRRPQRYFDPTVMVLPEAGTYGNMGRNVIIGPGLANMDMALIKKIELSEGVSLQFRGESFNVLNKVNWAQPSVSTFQSNGAYAGNVGAITGTSTSGRQMQLALKLLF